MDGIAKAIGQLKEGLTKMRQNEIEQRQRWFEMLARWETRRQFPGDDWTWRDFEDTSVAQKALEAQNLSTKALKARVTALLKEDEASRSPLICEIETGPLVGLADRIKALVEAGEDPNRASLLKDVPLAFARDRGVASIFDLLLELGADPAKIGFDALHQAVRFGTVVDVQGALPNDDPLLSKPDADAPLELAVKRGSPEILAALLDDIKVRGSMLDDVVDHCLGLAVQEGRGDLVKLFLERGADPDATLEDLTYRYDADILDLYIAHGADIAKLGDLSLYHEDATRICNIGGIPAISDFVDRLVAAGWRVENLDEFEHAQVRLVTKAYMIPAQDRLDVAFATAAEETTGTANPQEVTAPYHLEMARTGLSTFAARKDWHLKLPYPAWTADRFGQSTTRLPDGRWVQIAGEHEDSYDPDFEIFSDVVVHDGQGGMRVLFYPADIFPATDFHTASLVGNDIWIIGNTGYVGTRRVAETPVYRLDLDDFSIHRATITGDAPGWISRHHAEVEGERIKIGGGWIWTGRDFEDNGDVFWLDVASLRWARG